MAYIPFLHNAYFTAKVGIGTDDPGAKLDVSGDVLIDSGEYLSWGTVGATSIEGSTASNKLQFRTSSTDRMIINDTGVGIGTTSPTSLLEISKQLSAASTIDYPYTISSRDDGNSINQAGGEGVGIKFRIAGNAATTPGDSLVGASIAAIRESSSDSDSSTGLGFFVTQNDETLDEALRIDHDRNIQFNAYGAGTLVSDASGNITVSSGGGAGGPYLPLTAGSGFPLTGNLFIEGASTPKINITDTTNNLEGRIRVANNYMYIEADNSDAVVSTRIVLKTDGVEALYLDGNQDAIFPNGDVGIGTTNPGADLDVRHDAGGTVRIGTDTNNIGEDAAFGTLEFYNGDTSNSGPGVTAMIQAKTYNQYSTGGDITFSNKIYPSGTIAERMRIDSDGKVGIGTDNPSATLELNSDTGNAAKLKVGRQNGVTNYLELGTTGGSSVINAIGIAGVNADLIFNRSTTTATTQSMIINGSGNVGIGTSNFTDMSWASPALKLLGSRAGLGLYSTGALATLAFTSNADGTKAVHINQGSSGKISFYQYSQGSETLTLDNTGFLGVNTTLPSARLHVTGTAKITDLPYSPFGEMVTVSSAGQLTKKTSSSGGNYFADMSFGESYISNYKSRVLDYNGTYFPTAAASNVANHKANNLFNLITMMLLPGGVFTGKITAAKPKSGVDFAWTRTTVANYTDEEGVIQEAAIATPRIDYAHNSNGEILIEPTRTNLVPNSGPGDYGNGPGSELTVPGPNGIYDSAIVPVPNNGSDRYQYTIPSGTYNDGDVFTYSWYRRRLSTPVQATYVGDLSIQGLVNCSLTGATTQIESNISGFDRFACEITLTLANTTAIVRGYFGAIVGTGNSSVAYFGQQLELGDFATTLINTTGSAVTRDNDYMIVNNLSSTIFQGMVGQGGFYMDFDYKREGNADGLRFFDEDNITPRVYLYQGVTGISDTWNAGSFTLNQTSGNKIGYMFTSTTSAVYCANGSNIVTSSPTAAQALNTPLDTIYIDGNQNLVRIRELSMFTQMTSAQLVTLTTS